MSTTRMAIALIFILTPSFASSILAAPPEVPTDGSTLRARLLDAMETAKKGTLVSRGIKLDRARPKAFLVVPRGTDLLKNPMKGRDIVLEPREEEEGIDVHQIVPFELDSAELKPEAETILQEVVKALNDKPDSRLIVRGHTDETTGEPSHNDNLSSRRSAAVVEYLQKQGVSKDRLEGVALGSRDRLIDPEKSDEDMEKNRRVDFRLPLAALPPASPAPDPAAPASQGP